MSKWTKYTRVIPWLLVPLVLLVNSCVNIGHIGDGRWETPVKMCYNNCRQVTENV